MDQQGDRQKKHYELFAMWPYDYSLYIFIIIIHIYIYIYIYHENHWESLKVELCPHLLHLALQSHQAARPGHTFVGCSPMIPKVPQDIVDANRDKAEPTGSNFVVIPKSMKLIRQKNGKAQTTIWRKRRTEESHPFGVTNGTRASSETFPSWSISAAVSPSSSSSSSSPTPEH